MVLGARRQLAIGRKQRQLPLPLGAFIEGFDQMAPSLPLTVINLAQVQYLPLHYSPTSAALVLNNVPVAMLFAIFQASIESQKHANQPTSNPGCEIDTWSTLQPIYNRAPLIRLRFTSKCTMKIVIEQPELRKLG